MIVWTTKSRTLWAKGRVEDLQKEEGEQAARIEKAEAKVTPLNQYDDAKADVNEDT